MNITFTKYPAEYQNHSTGGSAWYSPIWMQKDGQEHFVINHSTAPKSDAWPRDNLLDVQRITKELINNEGTFFCFHGKSPFDLIHFMQEEQCKFEALTFNTSLNGYTDIRFNLDKVSMACAYRVYDNTVLIDWVEAALKIDASAVHAALARCKEKTSKTDGLSKTLIDGKEILKPVSVKYRDKGTLAALMDSQGRLIGFDSSHVYHPTGGMTAVNSIAEQESPLTIGAELYLFDAIKIGDNTYQIDTQTA
ncbi:hypothetical protein [Enterovibrio norvegicus]|uniref:hypothetical protein n=1 Tax=Enterovibrio norvegicus TaxID=188144 RepID=UPI00352FEA04